MEKGFSFTVTNKKAASNPKYKCKTVYFIGPDRPAMRALGVFRPPRLLEKSKEYWFNRRLWNGHSKKARVLSVEFVGEREVVALKTSSRTYMAEGFLSHNCNAEGNVILALAGEARPAGDFHEATARMCGLKPDEPLSVAFGSVREAAKSISHASNYLEGLQLVTKNQLNTPRLLREVAAGARLVFNDWKVEGYYVTFTGVNLARRAFGDATLANRKRALDFTARYYKAYPGIRKLQRHVLHQMELEHAVRPPDGYYLLSYGSLDERCKVAMAVWGSQPVAHLTKLALLRAHDDGRLRPTLQVHDELLFNVPLNIEPVVAAKYVREYMCLEAPAIKGLSLPVEIAHGPNWGDTVVL